MKILQTRIARRSTAEGKALQEDLKIEIEVTLEISGGSDINKKMLIRSVKEAESKGIIDDVESRRIQKGIINA